MTWIDILLITVIVVNLSSGFRQGFVLGVLAIVRWLGSLYIGFRFNEPAARLVGDIADWPEVWDRPAGFLLAVIAGSLAIGLVTRMLLRQLPREVHTSLVNRLLGLAPGLVNGLLTAVVITALLMALPIGGEMESTMRNSMIASRLQGISEVAEEGMTRIFGDILGRTTVPPATPTGQKSIPLPMRVLSPRARPDLEARMLAMVNRERAAAGLDPVAADTAMRSVARRHSIDMFARGYFSHYTPEGRSPFDRIHAAGHAFRVAGENLAIAPTLERAHTGLMESPGHRANILRPGFGRLGIGIMDGGVYGIMVTQCFRN